jgi:hypothetical protein
MADPTPAPKSFSLGDVLSDLPDLLNLVLAIEASVAAHKGEPGINAGIDVAIDVLPQFKALIVKIESQV